jgi:homoserine trans-succinylase
MPTNTARIMAQAPHGIYRRPSARPDWRLSDGRRDSYAAARPRRVPRATIARVPDAELLAAHNAAKAAAAAARAERVAAMHRAADAKQRTAAMVAARSIHLD